jgi:hypothetical protein
MEVDGFHHYHYRYKDDVLLSLGEHGGVVCWGSALQGGRPRVRFPVESFEVFMDIIHPGVLWPWSRLSLQYKWVTGVFIWGGGVKLPA